MEPGYGSCRPMESRDEAAPFHRTWKTPMKPAFPTAPTAPAAGKRNRRSKPETRHFASLQNRPRCLRLVSSMSPFVQRETRSAGEGRFPRLDLPSAAPSSAFGTFSPAKKPRGRRTLDVTNAREPSPEKSLRRAHNLWVSSTEDTEGVLLCALCVTVVKSFAPFKSRRRFVGR